MQYLTTCFWKRWLKEYLPSLTIRSKWTTESRNLKVDDLVIVEDKNVPRGRWKLARVSAIHPGDDNIVRMATVKTAAGEFTRPVAKLYLLEEASSE